MSVWVEILLDKFASHRPTERLLAPVAVAGTGRGGGHRGRRPGTPRTALSAALRRAARSAMPRPPFAQADETRWMVFVAQEGKAGYRWWLWVFLGEDTVVFRLDPDPQPRRARGPLPGGRPRGADGRPLLGVQSHGPGEAGQRGAGLLLGPRPPRFRQGRQGLARAQGVGLGLAPPDSRAVSPRSSPSRRQDRRAPNSPRPTPNCDRPWRPCRPKPMPNWPTRNCRLPAARCWQAFRNTGRA